MSAPEAIPQWLLDMTPAETSPPATPSESSAAAPETIEPHSAPSTQDAPVATVSQIDLPNEPEAGPINEGDES